MINIKKVRETPQGEDGYRILVDRLWPVGMSKEKAKLDLWLKDIGPSTGLRKWFSHDLEKWDEFKKRYYEELKEKNELLETIINKSKEGTVTLLFNSKEPKYNNAVALYEYIENMSNKQEVLESPKKEEPTEKPTAEEEPEEEATTEEPEEEATTEEPEEEATTEEPDEEATTEEPEEEATTEEEENNNGDENESSDEEENNNGDENESDDEEENNNGDEND